MRRALGSPESLRLTRTVAVPELEDREALGALAAALAHGGRSELKVDLLFVDDPTLSELHEQFLDDPSVTDVMAFDYTGDDDHLDEEDQSSPEAEVYVSVDRARAVAAERGESVREELLLYICLLYTSPSPRDRSLSRMPSSA